MSFFRVLCISLFVAGLLALAGPNAALADHSVEVRFTTEEANWLSQHPTIRIGPDPTFSPIEYFDDDGNFQGIAADYLRLLEKNLARHFRLSISKIGMHPLKKPKTDR